MPTYKVHHEYRTGATSLAQAQEFQGILSLGVYFGFDAITNGGGPGIKIVVNHEVTGQLIIGQDLATTAKAGIVRTPQGKVIHIIGPTDPITIAANPTGTPRIDWLILEHEHVLTVGGAEPTISVIQGPPDGNPPVLSNPLKQVLLGTILVAAGAVAFAELTYTPADRPGFAGDTDIMRLSKVQQNLRTKAMYKKGSFEELESVPVDQTKVHLLSDGNYFEIPDIGSNKIVDFVFDDIPGGYPPIGTLIKIKSIAPDGAMTFVRAESDDFFNGLLGVPSTASTGITNNDSVELLFMGVVDVGGNSIPRWRIFNYASEIVGRTLIGILPTLLGVDSAVTALTNALNTLTNQYEMNNPGVDGKGSANTGTFTIAGNNYNFHKMGRLCTINFRGASNVAITGSPTTLYISLAGQGDPTGSVPNFVEGPYAATMLLTWGTNDYMPVYVLLNTAQNRLEIKRADNGGFDMASAKLWGQITGATA